MSKKETLSCDHPHCEEKFISHGTTALHDMPHMNGWLVKPVIGGSRTYCPEHKYLYEEGVGLKYEGEFSFLKSGIFGGIMKRFTEII